ncbi:MAG: aldolase/citrate lyase family protein [Bacteroidales bacterium]|jgi:4-hydroxy-2-oxoheptanedioate aldolase|nr:aldolase/citrate lyase family protein [Bacteroidales bacterium]
MTAIEFKKALRAGKPVYGTLIVSTSPKWMDVISQLDLDFVFIDTEHIAIDRHQLSWMCHAYAGKGLVPVVRIPSPDAYQACMALDGGAKGIIVPYVETVDEVIKLSGAIKNRPIKGKKLADHLDGKTSLESELLDYIKKHNEDHIFIVNIESQPAIDNLDEIVRIPGVDAVLIGPHDLSCNLGIPEQYNHPKFKAAVEDIFTRARKAGIGAGMHVFYSDSLKHELEWAEKGANLILHSGDISRFAEIMREDIIMLKHGSTYKKDISSETVNI